MIDRNDIEFICNELDIYIQKSKIKSDFNFALDEDRDEIGKYLGNEFDKKVNKKKHFEDVIEEMLVNLGIIKQKGKYNTEIFRKFLISALITKPHYSKLKTAKETTKYTIISLGLAIIDKNLKAKPLQIKVFNSEANDSSKINELKENGFDAEINFVNGPKEFIVTVPAGKDSGKIMLKLRKAGIEYSPEYEKNILELREARKKYSEEYIETILKPRAAGMKYLPVYEKTILKKNPKEIMEELFLSFDNADYKFRPDNVVDSTIFYCLENHFFDIIDIDDILYDKIPLYLDITPKMLSVKVITKSGIDGKLNMVENLFDQTISECENDKRKKGLEVLKSKYKQRLIECLGDEINDAVKEFIRKFDLANKSTARKKLVDFIEFLEEAYSKYNYDDKEIINPLLEQIKIGSSSFSDKFLEKLEKEFMKKDELFKNYQNDKKLETFTIWFKNTSLEINGEELEKLEKEFMKKDKLFKNYQKDKKLEMINSKYHEKEKKYIKPLLDDIDCKYKLKYPPETRVEAENSKRPLISNKEEKK
jgi:hypothetical protein